MKLTSYTASGSKSTVTAKDEVFGLSENNQLVAQAVRVYLNNQRQGTGATQTRSDVSRTTKKWYRQKGTGNARHGARSAHIFVGGGVAFGPKADSNWSLKMPKKMKKKALATALSMQAANIVVSEAVAKLSGKTKEAAELITKVAPEAKRVLIVTGDEKPEVARSLRNISNTLVSHASRVNVYEVLNASTIIMTKSALQQLEEKLA